MSARSTLRGLRSRAWRRLHPLPFDDTGVHMFESACYAPHASMYFDQFGNARACCQNTDVVMGNISEQTISEIWHGATTRVLRDVLKVGDYSQGCGFCQWQVDQGDDAIVFARTFDEHAVYEEHPRWPVQMEFSMTNSCNLQCVMCNGDWSSSIRAHREHRPPLPEVYGDAFFEELEEFLPHLRKANFLGGEPFLGREPLRVLGMLAELPSPPSVVVTTNGTQWSDRIDRICERLPMSVVVSLDGITKSTYESIRVGADFDVVMENLERFRAYAARHDTKLSLAHCLMRPNWTEFAHLLRFAEDRGMLVGMNEVLFPVELSLFQLPAEELRHVVDTMDADADGTAASLDRLRPVWDGQLEALRHRLADLDGGEQVYVRPWADPSEQNETWAQLAERTLAEWISDEPPAIAVLEPGGVTTLEGGRSDFLATLGVAAATGVADVLAAIDGYLGAAATTSRPSSGLMHDVVVVDASGGHETQFRAAWATSGDVTTVYLAVRNPPLAPDLPDDPLGVMTRWSGSRPITVVHCGEDERVRSVSGDAGLLGLESEHDLLGRSVDDLFELLVDRLGSAEISPGPSGFPADSMVTVGGAEGGRTTRLRVMVDRTGTSLDVLLALEPDPDEGDVEG
jgi:MoaA/NifB/PqqE/SkfB family radical SAM enzyme